MGEPVGAALDPRRNRAQAFADVVSGELNGLLGSSPGTISLTIAAISPSAVTAARSSPRNTGMPFSRCSSVTHLKGPVGFA